MKRKPWSPSAGLIAAWCAALACGLLGWWWAWVIAGPWTIAAFEALGVTPTGAALLLGSSLLGSFVDLPLGLPGGRGDRGTMLALNVGGCLVPLSFSMWIVVHQGLPAVAVAAGVGAVALACRLASRVDPGIGVTMPGFVAPLAALFASLALAPAHPAPLAYVSGTAGVLVGADLTRLREARALAAPMLSIGGAGTRDGIFLAGLVAVLLAL